MALEMRTSCERCGRETAPTSADVFICSYECTFCADCAAAMDRVCPNCRGRLEKRPPRAAAAGDAIQSTR